MTLYKPVKPQLDSIAVAARIVRTVLTLKIKITESEQQAKLEGCARGTRDWVSGGARKASDDARARGSNEALTQKKSAGALHRRSFIPLS